jgi:predicted PurR-regulated permease PerM
LSSLKLWLLTFGIILVILFIWIFGDIITLFITSGAIAFLLIPLIDFLQKKLKFKRRIWPTLLVFLGVLGLLIGLLAVVLPMIYQQFKNLLDNASSYSDSINNLLDNMELYARSIGIPDRLIDAGSEQIIHLEDWIMQWIINVGKGVLNTSLKMLDVVLFLCLTFYFMLDGRNIYRSFEKMFPPSVSIRVHRIAIELDEIVWRYLKARVLISLGTSIVSLIFFVIIGLPYALLLALLTFFMDFIPYIGSLISGSAAVITALITGGWGSAVIVLVFVIVSNQIEGNILSPRLQAKAIHVHPVAILFSMLACHKLWGVFGMFVSVPMAGLVKVFMIEFRDLYRSIDGQSELPPPPERKETVVDTASDKPSPFSSVLKPRSAGNGSSGGKRKKKS